MSKHQGASPSRQPAVTFARRTSLLMLALILALLPATAAEITSTAPLPNPEQLRRRALDTFHKTQEQREHYLCHESQETQKLTSKGAIKKTETQQREIFFVNGRQLASVVSNNGKPLSAGDSRKQNERLRKDIERYQKAGARTDQAKDGSVSVGDILRLVQFNNERREFVAGRPTIYFDVAGDPSKKTSDIAQRAVQAMQGSLRLDEKTGTPMDINVHSVRDVKMAGGLVANIHKGFLLHVQLMQRPDGVWLIDRAEGSGDARLGLFFHPYFRFKQQTGACKLFNASADDLKDAHVAQPNSADPK